MRDPFHKLIDHRNLAGEVGEKSFARCAGYFEGGAVIDRMQTRKGVKTRMLSIAEYRFDLGSGRCSPICIR